MNILNTFHHDVFAAIGGGQWHTPTSALEIGVQEGNSTEAIVKAFPYLRHLTLCDDWGRVDGGTGRGNHDHVEQRLDALGYQGHREYLDGKSQNTVPALIREGRTFDLVHVDGDHSPDGARCDLENALRLKPRWVVTHDIFFPGVWEAASQWMISHRTTFREVAISAHDTGTLVVML